MKKLLAPIALAAIALPGAAFAAEDAMEKCCCEKMKEEGKDCCPKDAAHDESAHGDHADPAQHDSHPQPN